MERFLRDLIKVSNRNSIFRDVAEIAKLLLCALWGETMSNRYKLKSDRGNQRSNNKDEMS